MDSERLYLDYNATSPLSQSVIRWLKSGDFLFANPASQHTSGKASRKLINQIRGQIFDTFSVNEKDFKLFFHSGATEGILSFAYGFKQFTRTENKKLYICVSEVDHPVVLSLKERIEGDTEIISLKRKSNLEYDHEANFKLLKSIKDKFPESVFLYHHLWVHNETGLVSPLEDLQVFKSIPNLFIHVDAVQTVGKITDWRELKVGDIFTYSAHKFGALKSVGFSLFSKETPFSALMTGGGQQSGLRSGTENPMAIKSVGLALADAIELDVQSCINHRIQFQDFLKKELEGIGGVIEHDHHNSNTLYFYLDKITSDIGLAMFDLEGLEISAGSACSSGAAKESLVMLALGKSSLAKNGLRISFSMNLSSEELKNIQKRFAKIFARIRISA